MDIKKGWKQQWHNALTKPNNAAALQWDKAASLLKIQPETFLDIGAGEFESEAWAIKKTHPDCKIIGFEPQPVRFQTLKNHNYPGLLLPFVINKTCGMTKGYMGYPEGKSDFYLFGSNEHPEAYKKINIESFTLDYLEQKYGPFNNAFIWADVEGSELCVLQGAQRLFNENKIVGVNVEVRPNGMAPGTCTENQILEFMEKNKLTPTPYSRINSHYDIIFIKNN